jgi:hypothetical protein
MGEPEGQISSSIPSMNCSVLGKRQQWSFDRKREMQENAFVEVTTMHGHGNNNNGNNM